MNIESQRGHTSPAIVLLLIVIGFIAGFALRPVYEAHYGKPSTEKLGAEVGRSIDKALDKTGEALEKAGEKLQKD